MTEQARTPRGHNLIELGVVVAIAGLALAAAAPSLGRLLDDHRVRTTASLVQLSLARARNEAIASGRPVTLCPRDSSSGCRTDSDWSGGTIVHFGDRFDPGADSARLDESAILESSPFLEGAAVRVSTVAGRRAITYRPDGAAGGSNATFTVCLPGSAVERRRVIVSNPGRTRVEKGAPGCD